MPLSALMGTRIRERRAALGLRQGDLAQAAGISASYLNLIEHNRRKVTAEVLARLATALGAEVAAFSDGADSTLVEDLRAAAAALPAAGAEVERTEEFTGRYPGWAALAVGLHRRVETLDRAVAALNDRLGHDPHLSDALHELLSALSGVRATASILAESEDLEAEWRRRFHQNLFQDSERLSLGAEALVAYLDRSQTAPEEGVAAPQDEVEAWLAARGWHVAAAEAGDEAAALAEAEALASSAGRELARAHVRQALADARALPLGPLRAAMAELGPDPVAVAARLGAGVIATMRRMALRPDEAQGPDMGPEMGLVLCDGSGTLLLRKPTPGFALPRFGAACPIWPLFSALARPGLPVQAMVETAGAAGGVFRALAYCETRPAFGFDGPDLRTAAMLILPVGAVPAGKGVLAVGSTCRICPRGECPARREPSILGGPMVQPAPRGKSLAL